ncbi:MAG: PEP-CTERM sorting domain-containing protein [Aquabacterium sp.]|nr:PEP-CTERM sorting domain-containing protein [Aquabacterium sp.]
MLFKLNKILSVVVLSTVFSAHAAPLTLDAGTQFGNLVYQGGLSTLTLSNDLLGALDSGKVALSPFGGAVADVIKDVDGYYTKAAFASHVTRLTIDGGNNVLDAYSDGGSTQTHPALRSVSIGGFLTLHHLWNDMETKTVHATLEGGNGVGTITDIAVWNIGKMDGIRPMNAAGDYTSTLSQLSITSSALDAFSKSLGLLTLGKSALAGVTDFGSITSTIHVGTAAVPEPSTYAMLGIGLLGMTVLARRRRQSR